MKSTAEQNLKLAAIGLSGLLILQLLWSGARLLLVSAPDPVAPVESVLQPGLINYRAPAPTAASEVVSRPLFWQGRNAFVYDPSFESVEDGPAAPASDAINKVKLVGLYSGHNPGVIVMLRGKRHRVSVNESLEGWTLSLMNANEAVFENGGDTRTIELQHVSPKGATPTLKPASREVDK